MEDFGAISLWEYTQKNSLEEDEFLDLALKASECISRLHELQHFHAAISAKHFLWNKDTGILKLTDFGVCSELVQDNVPILSTDMWDNDMMQYSSPEQTGRMNREVDYRTDLYSFGVLLYRLAVGRLPFEDCSGADLMYAHIAKQPKLPHECNANIHPTLSKIIMHLLQKSSEDRYQSAIGFKRDLLSYMSDRDNQFDVGALDISPHFHASKKIYGRDEQIQFILDVFDQVNSNKLSANLLLLSGYSGIGKTALINQVHKPLCRQRGNFVSGKFDQFKKNSVPYGCFIEAFRKLVKS
ncbi:hypothetical protein AKO1_015796, partial [Acrasis kona]